jgi:hypothetical protein
MDSRSIERRAASPVDAVSESAAGDYYLDA